jgi:transcriptional regulator of arginine metabolism
MSNTKQGRHALIRQVLRDDRIDTHERLAHALTQHGIDVSQSTLSKDLRELGVVRIPQVDGGFRYSLADNGMQPADRHLLERELHDHVTDVERAVNIVVIKTRPGHAQAVCEAVDRMAWPEVMGTLAGENTIFVVSRTPVESKGICGHLATLTGLTVGDS